MGDRLWRQDLAGWAGWILGPVCWLANTQLGQMLPYAECAGGFRFSILASFLGASLAALGGLLSWRGSRRQGQVRFFGTAGALVGLTIAFALVLQGAAALVLSGCER